MYNTRDLEEEINLTLLSEAINAGQSFNTPMTGLRNDMDRIKDIKKSGFMGTRFSTQGDNPDFVVNNPQFFTDQDRKNISFNLRRFNPDRVTSIKQRRENLKKSFDEEASIRLTNLPDDIKSNIRSFTGTSPIRFRRDNQILIEPNQFPYRPSDIPTPPPQPIFSDEPQEIRID